VAFDADFTGAVGLFRNGGLGVFGLALSAVACRRLLREALGNPMASVMVCPSDRRRDSRTLVLQHGDGTLRPVLALCRALAARPVVLTVARTERRAEVRQKAARAAIADAGLDADFDLIAGCDLRTAVTRAAAARGCSRVVLGRGGTHGWRRWFGGDATRTLLALADRLTLVSLADERAGRPDDSDAPGGLSVASLPARLAIPRDPERCG
jgi:hypothetical protein